MNRSRTGLFYWIWFLLGFSATAFAQQMNVLFIAVDDLKPNLGAYGDLLVQSPNIDLLAEAGTTFLNNHCQQAICSPSRASLLTGWRPDRTGVWTLETIIRDINPDVVTLPQYFRQNGYQTAGLGKVFDSRTVDAQFDSLSWSVPFINVIGNRWIDSENRTSNQSGDVADDFLIDGMITNESITLLDQLAAENSPFFLAVGFRKPHLPFVAPQRYWDLYERSDFELPRFQEQAVGSPNFGYPLASELRGYDDIPDEGGIAMEKQLELIHAYYACTSYIDAQVGALMNHLETLGIRDNTIVVLWGDHGWHLGDHDLWGKSTNYEQATRSPLVISVPGQHANQKSNSPTELVDLFPTLCDLTGLPIPENLAGKSLLPILQDAGASVKDFAVSQYPRIFRGEPIDGYALRTERYRYVEWLGDFKSTMPYNPEDVRARELYDYEVDPLETVNLIDSAAYQNIAMDLQNKLIEFFASQAVPVGIADIGTVPDDFHLLQNYPNPFNPVTNIGFRISEFGFLSLKIYDAAGKLVKTLVSENYSPGVYNIQWDSLNDAGQKVASGIYFAAMQFKLETRSRKMLLIR